MPSTLSTRPLGTHGPLVTSIGYGMMGLSAFYGPHLPDTQRLAFLDKLYAAGQRFWDTSDIYGDSEDLLGTWFSANSEKREDIILATKFGNLGAGVARTDPKYVLQACDRSLKRLKTAYIDLYYVHRADPEVPIEETVRAMEELRRQGKIRFLGLSEVSARTLRRAHAVTPITSVQVEYSPFALEIESTETDLLATCKELGVAIVAYSPLGRGFLTGALRNIDDLDPDDFRRKVPRYFPENFSKNIELVKALQRVAERKGCSPGQLVLAWLLAQWEMVIPIPGTTRWQNYEENMASLNVSLGEDEVREIRGIIEGADVVGARFPEAWTKHLFVDTVPLKE
ncbi:Aldo/keto reductase [Aspergillus granulosus]|uniref:Aldo/keto reductase n=1 Tax=Aspergillus granulosus TaxID=176169 RepID=A0ABR4HAN5_9EURO